MSIDIEYSRHGQVAHIVDHDGEQLRLAFFDGGVEGAQVIASVEEGEQVAVDPRELIAAIAKISGLTVILGEHQDWASLGHASVEGILAAEAEEPEPFLREVEYRPARAVEITEEFVQSLLTDPVDRLEARFFAKTGKPRGVAFYSAGGMGAEIFVGLGEVIVIRRGQDPQPLHKEQFEAMYQEVAA